MCNPPKAGSFWGMWCVCACACHVRVCVLVRARAVGKGEGHNTRPTPPAPTAGARVPSPHNTEVSAGRSTLHHLCGMFPHETAGHDNPPAVGRVLGCEVRSCVRARVCMLVCVSEIVCCAVLRCSAHLCTHGCCAFLCKLVLNSIGWRDDIWARQEHANDNGEAGSRCAMRMRSAREHTAAARAAQQRARPTQAAPAYAGPQPEPDGGACADGRGAGSHQALRRVPLARAPASRACRFTALWRPKNSTHRARSAVLVLL